MDAFEILEPTTIVELEPGSADRLLDRLEARVPIHPALERLPGAPLRWATVLGDTHGDWPSTLEAARRFRADPGSEALVSLGDTIDRPPPDCESGSVANALFLLQLAAAYPDRVLLVQGNHETHQRIAVLPHTLAEEVDQLWGPVESRYTRILGLLARGPLAVSTESGAYLAHAGFPRTTGPAPYPDEFRSIDDEALIEIVWGEASVGRSRRGVVRPFDEAELERFFDRSGHRIFLRGHDPDLTGRPIYHGRCLTLHTCRIYERFGGVIVARLPLDRPVESVLDVPVEHLRTEGAGASTLD